MENSEGFCKSSYCTAKHLKCTNVDIINSALYEVRSYPLPKKTAAGKDTRDQWLTIVCECLLRSDYMLGWAPFNIQWLNQRQDYLIDIGILTADVEKLVQIG